MRRKVFAASSALVVIVGALGVSSAQPFTNPPIPPGLLGGNPTSMNPVPKLAPGSPTTLGTTPDGKPYVPPAGAAEWTILVYEAADNNLESALLDDVGEMQCVGSNTKVNLVAQIDRWDPGGDPSDDTRSGNWNNARRYLLTKNKCDGELDSKLLEDMPELDMSHPKELAKFIAWGAKKFPAKHYALVMGDHGSGWKGGYVDEDAPPENQPMLMSIAELQSALAEGRKDAGIPKFDLLATDACMMGAIEVADAIWPHVSYWAASEELVPGPGYDYEPIMKKLSANPTMDGAMLGKAFVDSVRTFYGPGKPETDPSVTQALFDLSKTPVLRGLVDKLATLLKSDLDGNKVSLAIAGEAVDQFGPSASPMGGSSEGFADLVQVAAVIRDTTTKADVKAAAAAVIAALDGQRLDKFNGDDKVNARGMTIWLPPTEDIIDYLPSYKRTPFGKSSPWSDLLTVYSHAFDKSTAPKISNVQVVKGSMNPFDMGPRKITAQIDGEIRDAVFIVSQNFLSTVVPVEINPIGDPALFKKLAEGPGVTAWKKGVNVVSGTWTPAYITLSGKGGLEFPLVVNHERLGGTTFDAEVTLKSLTANAEEAVLLRFASGANGIAGAKLLSGFFVDKTEGEVFYTPFDVKKLPANKVAFEPRYTVVDGSGKSSTLKLPISVKWDTVADIKLNLRPMLPGIYTITLLAEDFAGHIAVQKISTTLP